MSKQRLHVPAGKLFCISRGEYSDYGYEGHFLALVEITPEMFREAEKECNEAALAAEESGAYVPYGDASEKFLPTLIKRGWVMDVDCVEIHSGSYGRLDLS